MESLVSAGLAGLVRGVLCLKGSLWGPGWLLANDTCEDGCQSRVATLSAKGSERRWLMPVARSRPPSTAREPFYGVRVSRESMLGRWRGGRTGGQKSSCMSTTSTAGLKVVVEAIVMTGVWYLISV